MRNYTTYFNSSQSKQHRDDTLAYKQRVEADGGTVVDAAFVDSCFAFAATHSLDVHHWVSPRFGLKMNGNGGINRLYCLMGKDLITTSGNPPTLDTFNGKNIIFANNQPMDAVDSAPFNIGTGSMETFSLVNFEGAANGCVYAKSIAAGTNNRYAVLIESSTLYSLYSGTNNSYHINSSIYPNGWCVVGQEVNRDINRHALRVNNVVQGQNTVPADDMTTPYRYVFMGYMTADNNSYYTPIGLIGKAAEHLRINNTITPATRTAIHAMLDGRFA